MISFSVLAMASNNYRIRPDSINVGGSDVQVSTLSGYKMIDTIGEVGAGGSFSPSGYKLKAGYRQIEEAIYISLTVPDEGDLVIDQPNNMEINVHKVTNTATGGVWRVQTNAPAGYTLSFSAGQTNCLRKDGSAYFTDYTEALTGTPEAWSADSSSYQFGFSAFGNDVNTGTWGSGTVCYDAGTTIPTNKYYLGLKGTENILVASSGESTAGTNTALCLAAEQKDVFAPNGSYSCQITGTAITQ
ncbi:MAG: hypothetical protein FJZ07_00560 [Candidatus Nealsonbacteria bacterium]|nr:hypothetical protein [Candidatus Nealsonbacteria bacterium]